MAQEGVNGAPLSPFGLKVEAVLKRQGRARAWLQDRLKVSRSTLYRLLTGKQPVTLDDIQRIASALEIKPRELVPAYEMMRDEADVPAPDENWEPSNAVREDEPTYAGAQLEDFLSNMDRIARTLRNFPGGDLGMKLKIGFLNAVEDVARDTGNKLPLEYYQLRKRVADGEL